MTQAKRPVLPVIFRKDSEGWITAVFPTLPFSGDGADMTCYAHVGQHGACSYSWLYNRTKPAKPEEYADLLAEISHIYGNAHFPGDEAYDLKVYRRIQPSFRRENLNECRRLAELASAA